MALRRELLLTIGTLVLLNLLLAFGAIGLFARMGPVIERILDDNVFSITAAEEIVATLASEGTSVPPEAASAMQRALEQAKSNVTEPEEHDALRALQSDLPGALSGEAEARKSVVVAAEKLIRVNRAAMRRVDGQARRLGESGAWAAVFIGFLSFLLGVLLIVRLQRRFVAPLLDLHEVLQQAAAGNRFRRCRLADAPHEVIQLTQCVNRLLDERPRSESKRPGDASVQSP